MSAGTVISSIFAILLSLVFVIGLAWGALWLLRKFQDGSFGKLKPDGEGRTLRFERALPVGPRERIVIVEVEGEYMMLGVTAQSITQLRTWPKTAQPRDDIEDRGRDSAEEPKRPRFRLPMADRDVS